MAQHRLDAGDPCPRRWMGGGEAFAPADRTLPTAEGDHAAQRRGERAPVAHPHRPPVGLELAAMTDDVAERIGRVEGGEERP